jgi:hypothetical protein
MTTKAPTSTRRVAQRRPVTKKPSRTPTARQRTPQAGRALELFASLRPYFAYDRELAEALGWDEATVSEWRRRKVVRPQRAKVIQVLLLHELCDEAQAYLRSPTDVGNWINTPLPNLSGATPAGWLAANGVRGLSALTRGMVDWMPRMPEADLEPFDEQAALAALEFAAATDAGARELKRLLSELG